MFNNESFELVLRNVKDLLQFDTNYDGNSEILDNIISDLKSNQNGFETDEEIETFLEDLRDRIEKSNRGESINLFPSENKKIGCRKFCVAIASLHFDQKTTKNSSGFKGVMLEMAAYWLHCLSINQSTLIITGDFVPRQFKELYKKIIDNYVTTHNKKVVVIEVSTSGIFQRY